MDSYFPSRKTGCCSFFQKEGDCCHCLNSGLERFPTPLVFT
ncbi:hypothetical protein CLOSTMETH_03447 [[Clostridium] methylpentosum DSM 5476]|uniref:Uncharacterized protein n=1 Tax=[Clostridium] methylpentosum DSM 5476 TaxID=537013 RepID=C0EHV2_9FIRM|nr:hypothetical protein CLOSTMETH_03447 [[Clostridium] methylpentosum DSM 5476]